MPLAYRYCYWSVCDGPYAKVMEHCVHTARSVGVLDDFHVFANRPVYGCKSYDCHTFDKEGGWFKILFLKAGMTKLPFEYFIWLDADTIFVRRPDHILDVLRGAQFHVPLTRCGGAMNHPDAVMNGLSATEYVEMVRACGVTSPAYQGRSAFWIVHRDLVDKLFQVCLSFRVKGAELGHRIDFSAALSYAAQTLCERPEDHVQRASSIHWASDDEGYFKDKLPKGHPWPWTDPCSKQVCYINPDLVHIPSLVQRHAKEWNSEDYHYGAPEKLFTEIYQANAWQGRQSVSGTGSDSACTQVLVEKVTTLFKSLRILSVLDIPCGDFFWMRSVDLGGIDYWGADIVLDLVNKNKRYESKNVHFTHLDLTHDRLPHCELVLVRDCLVHFSYVDIFRSLRNIVESGAKFLLTTTFKTRRANVDISTGHWRTLNLEVAPFNLPKPIMLIDENYTGESGQFSDKSLGLWRISDVQQALLA